MRLDPKSYEGGKPASLSAAAVGGAGGESVETMVESSAGFHSVASAPQSIHFIWLGDKSIPLQYVLNILCCLQDNKDHYAINLWVNPEFFSKVDFPQYRLYKLLESKGVKLRSHGELHDAKYDYIDLLILVESLHRSKPVVASDILRLLILFKEGGFYFDTDTLFKKPLPAEPIDFIKDTTFVIDVLNGGPFEPDSPFNSFLVSATGSIEVRILLYHLQKNLGGIDSEKILAWGKEDVIKNTGPGLLWKLGETLVCEESTVYAAIDEETMAIYRAGAAAIAGLPPERREHVLASIGTIKMKLEAISEKVFRYSRAGYEPLQSFKSHQCDGNWYAPGPKNLENRREAKVRAAATLLLWKRGRLKKGDLREGGEIFRS